MVLHRRLIWAFTSKSKSNRLRQYNVHLRKHPILSKYEPILIFNWFHRHYLVSSWYLFMLFALVDFVMFEFISNNFHFISQTHHFTHRRMCFVILKVLHVQTEEKARRDPKNYTKYTNSFYPFYGNIFISYQLHTICFTWHHSIPN